MTEYSDTMKRRRTDLPTEGETTDVSMKSEELPPALPNPLQTPSISSSIMAQSGGTAISPTLAGNTFHGPVCFKYYTGSAGATSARSEKVHASVSSDANIGPVCSSQVSLSGESTNKISEHTKSRPECDEYMIKGISKQIKNKLRRESDLLFEGPGEEKTPQHLNDVYTELYITDGVNEEVKTQHEFRQMDVKSQSTTSTQAPIKCNNIFKHSTPIRTVMTKGIAGIGKSVAVQKFILDWREGKANQDVDFIFLLPFRELNFLINDQLSLLELLCKYHPVLRDKLELFDKAKMIFIFDGLDESKFRLNFRGIESLENITDKSSVDVLIVNLLNENLLPSASIWVTTRPAAAHQIPLQYIDRWTEIHGFNDLNKEQYFRNKINSQYFSNKSIKDEEKNIMTGAVMKQIKQSRSLYVMCRIPVFCWILATVVFRMGTVDKQEIPQSLTELFAHFILVQFIKKEKMEVHEHKDLKQVLKSNKDVILKLSEMAYRELEKDNILFSEKDLEEYRIDRDKDLEKSGMCTEIFVSETVLVKKKVFCFVHLSIQEFLAALFVFYSFSTGNFEMIKCFEMEGQQLHHLLKSAVKKSLQSENGHLDLFLRFLLGLSLESNQRLFEGLLTHTQEPSERRQEDNPDKETIQYIKDAINKHNKSTERCINLLLCLLELKDHSLHREVEEYVKKGELLSPAVCSMLAYMMLVSEETQDEIDLTRYNTTDKGRPRLVIAVRSCKKGRLVSCGLNKDSCETITSALQSENSPLKELDLSCNDLRDAGVEVLSQGLSHTKCNLETLRLASCNLTVCSSKILAPVLRLSKSHLRHLDLTNNDLSDGGVQELSSALGHPNCRLHSLILDGCNLTEQSCRLLAAALQSGNSHLMHLDLTNNDLGEAGVDGLSAGLGHQNCKLEILKLSGCLVSEKACKVLTSVLTSKPSPLKVLDLSYNHTGQSGLSLCSKFQDKGFQFNIDFNAEQWMKPGLQKYACELRLDINTAHPELILSENSRKVTRVEEDQDYPDRPQRFDCCPQLLCTEGLIGRHYWEAEWSGSEAVIGVAYKSIRRKAHGADCKIGLNVQSYGLWCEGSHYSVRYDKNKTDVPVPSSGCNRIGVYLDWPAGVLSFYAVSSGKLTHLHTFHSRVGDPPRPGFSEPLYPGFWVHWNSTVGVCGGLVGSER